MRKIRIGNDVEVQWEVKTGGEALSLEGRELKVYVRSAYSRQEVDEFSVEGCVVSFVYKAERQKTTGARSVELADVTEGSARRTVCADEAFQLVAHTCEEDEDTAVETAAHEDFGRYLVSLRSNVLVGRPGMSAYDLWLADGHTGTREDYMKWLREPADEAAESVAEAETERAKAEAERAQAETGRVAAEAGRTEAEAGRVAAEAEREAAFAEQTKKLGDKKEEVDNAVSEMRTDVGAAIASAEEKTAAAIAAVEKTESGVKEAEERRKADEEARKAAETARNAAFEEKTAAAEKAAADCEKATEGAERVNVELTGKNINITDRNGKTKTVQIEDTPESVTVRITTTVDGMSVEGIKVNVYLNNGKTPQTYAADADGIAKFSVDKGNYYEVVVPEYSNAQPVSPVGYTAVVPERTINLEYKPYDEDTSEKVVISVGKYAGTTRSAWAGKAVKITCDGKTTVYQTDAGGQVTALIPYGKQYSVSVDDENGYYVKYKRNTRALTAEVARRMIDYSLYEYRIGVFILDKDGEEYNIDQWQASGKTSDEAIAIKVATLTLQQKGGTFCLKVSDLKNWDQIPQKQWCTKNVLFTSIAENGNTASDPLYYNGEQASRLIREEAATEKELSIKVPAAEYAYEQTLEIGGETMHGFLMAVGQEQQHWSVADVIRDYLNAIFGDTTGTTYYSRLQNWWRWTSTQFSSSSAWYYAAGAYDNNKSEALRVLPSFAC